MVNLNEQIIEQLKTVEYPITIKSISDVYEPKVCTPPFILVQEVGNTTNLSSKNVEKRIELTYQVNVVTSTSKTKNGEVLTNIQAVRLIYDEVDKVMREYFGLERIRGIAPSVPISNSTTAEMVGFYEGLYDVDSDTIFKL